MDTKIEIFYDQTNCRVCLLNNQKNIEMLPLFNTTIKSITISGMFISCTKLPIQPNDGFPSFICRLCLVQLVEAYEFKSRCIKSNNLLRMSLNKKPIESPPPPTTTTHTPTKSFTEVKIEQNEPNQRITSFLKPVNNIEIQKETNNRTGVNETEIACDLDGSALKLEQFKKYNKERNYKCMVCNKRFTRLSNLKRHHRQFHGSSHPLAYTNLNGPKKACDIDLEKMKTNKEQNYKCLVCNKTFRRLFNFRRHHRKSHAIEMLPTSNGMELNEDDEPSYNCVFCNSVFANSKELQYHIRIHIPPIEKTKSEYLCAECAKTFATLSRLKQHTKTHTFKEFGCTQCSFRSCFKRKLQEHMLVHTETPIKLFCCDICPAKFSRQCVLQKHKKIHTDRTKFTCEICKKRFCSRNIIKIHMRTHTGEKPYKCKYCERAFTQAGDLNKHTRIHVGEKTYNCDECPTAFKFLAELRKHKSIHFLAQKENSIE